MAWERALRVSGGELDERRRMTADVALLSDQVFQLNTFLWALEDLPDGGPYDPVLRKAGYYLNSIGRRVLVPVEANVVATLAKLTGSSDRSPVHPDLWLRHASHAVDPIIELKARGFSPASSNRRQALKLIASAADLAPSLGESAEREGHVIYATVAVDGDDLSDTLNELAQALEAETAAAAPTGVIGLSMMKNGIALSSPHPANLPTPAASVLAEPTIVLKRDDENDLQPLYLVPWIPGNDDGQDSQLRSDGLRELTARVFAQILADVGQAQAPTTVTLSGTELLSRATFGIFRKWRDTDRQQFSEAVAKIAERVLRPVVEVRREGGDHVEVDLPDAESQDSAIDRLESADPSNPTANLEAAVEEPPTLFDEI